jgi:hypothetical protein
MILPLWFVSFGDFTNGDASMKRLLFGTGALVLAFAVTLSMSRAAQEDKPKHTIKEVMKTAHKEKLVNKVADGKASAAEKAQLVELYTALAKNKPPKGEAASWKEKTDALIKAATAAKEGKDGAGEQLKKASNCKGCHEVHKG